MLPSIKIATFTTKKVTIFMLHLAALSYKFCMHHATTTYIFCMHQPTSSYIPCRL